MVLLCLSNNQLDALLLGGCRKALCFAYMDVAMRRSDKGREQDAVSFSGLRSPEGWC
jgi:hypothetical protein